MSDVRLTRLHEVETRANVGTSAALGHEAERKGITTGASTVGRSVLSTIETAVLGASVVGRAQCSIPLVSYSRHLCQPFNLQSSSPRQRTSVAVGRSTGRVSPTPIGINNDLTGHVGAGSSGGTLLPGHGRVRLGGQGADLLGTGGGQQGRDGGQLGVHGCLGRAGSGGSLLMKLSEMAGDVVPGRVALNVDIRPRPRP